MITSVRIKNFKSVVDLSLDLGTFNVLIGENGCGKSNILEAIAFGAAASADKLDFEFLGSRGIRVPNPEFIFSAFKDRKDKDRIDIEFFTDDKIFKEFRFFLSNDTNNPRKWVNEYKEIIEKEAGKKLAFALFEKQTTEDRKSELKKMYKDEESVLRMEKFANDILELSEKNGKKDEAKDFFDFIFNSQFLKDKYSNDFISNYIIYSPEQSSLRKFEETTQIYPLGVKGEGIFQYLKELSLNKKYQKSLSAIKDSLHLLDWYEDFEMPDNSLKNEFSLKIKDKFLFEKLQYFDQRSTNEGFLYLLFYATLFVSKDTPQFFAIDNIDASLNPKLCIQLIRTLAVLAKKYKKQVIVTTQNPAILDGLNLKDDHQRLFVASRNNDGYTRVERISFNENRTMKLSEVWTKGFIGGLPSNF